MNGLVVDMRGSRQGFPKKVLEEILFISELYARWRKDRRRRADEARLDEISARHLGDIEMTQQRATGDLLAQLQNLKQLINKDDIRAIDYLSKNKIGVNQKDSDGQTPLMHAVSANAEQVTLSLIKLNANPHVYDVTGNTSLHWAVAMNRLRMVEILLYFGANADTKNKAGATPLSLAVIKNDPSITKRLLDYGADVMVMDHNGSTPLHKAVQAKAMDNVWLLLMAGASKETKNRDGLSCSDLAERASDIKQLFDKHRSDLLRASMGER